MLSRIGVLPLAMAGALAVGGFAGALVAHDRTEASDLTRAASARWTYGEAVAVATSVLPPVGAQDQNGSACHVMGRVRCWTIHGDVRVLGSELSGKLGAATGLTPEVTWRYTDPRATGDAGIRTSVPSAGKIRMPSESSAFPCSAALRYHLAASDGFFATPVPFS